MSLTLLTTEQSLGGLGEPCGAMGWGPGKAHLVTGARKDGGFRVPRPIELRSSSVYLVGFAHT